MLEEAFSRSKHGFDHSKYHEESFQKSLTKSEWQSREKLQPGHVKHNTRATLLRYFEGGNCCCIRWIHDYLRLENYVRLKINF